jgi:hypothetical protein
MVACVDHFEGYVFCLICNRTVLTSLSPPFHLLDAYGSQPGRPIGARHRSFV